MSSAPEIPTLLDEAALVGLHEDFASTGDLDELATLIRNFLARAARCAVAITQAVRTLGLEVRAGVHTGEVELIGDDVGGLGVHLGARVGALAGAGEVLASQTVRDLVVGSGIEWDDRGAHELKGVPGEWRLYAATGERTGERFAAVAAA